MQHQYRYHLEKGPGKKKIRCPECSHIRFTRYVDSVTGERLADDFGKCDRINSCGYHCPPPHGSATGYTGSSRVVKSPVTRPADIIQPDLVERSLDRHIPNHFFTFLVARFGREAAEGVANVYKIGSSTQRPGATVFWQVDRTGAARTGKIMIYDPASGKRVKTALVSWAHSAMKIPNYELRQCLFGEHLLTDTSKVVAVVESEKSAIIASLYWPEYTWVACGGAEGLTPERCNALRGRQVVLFPDNRCYELWSVKAGDLSFCSSLVVSRFIEDRATNEEWKQGLDIADYLLRFNPEDFRCTL